MMRHLYALSLAAVLCSGTLSAQHWTQGITSERPTFHEVEKAFTDFWAPFNVKNGWYTDSAGVRHKAPGWKQFQRWAQHWRVRTGPSGVFPTNRVECDAWDRYVKEQGGGAAKSSANWTSMGPYNATGIAGVGRINCIAFHPTNTNTFWVGTPAGGLWKTTNGGTSWTTNTDDLPVLGVSWIAIHPNDPNTMYIATGDGDAALSLSAFGHPFAGDTKSIGVLKSTNGGSTWTQVLSADQSDGVLIRKILIDPAFPTYVYAATNYGIYQTDDGGASWTNILPGYFMDIEFHPTNPDIVYAASYDPAGNAQVYRTIDFGQNWSQVTALSGVNRIDIAVCPAAPNAVDILCSDANTHAMHSMHYSTNSGAIWAPYWTGGPGYNLLGWMGDASDNSGQGSYDLTLAIDPANYNNIYVGGVNLWRTNDGGSSWSPSNVWTGGGINAPPGTPVVHADKHHVVFHPSQANVLYDCNDGGVYRSTNGGSTWTNLTNGMAISQMYSISNAQSDPTVVLAGLQDNGSIGLDAGSWQELTGGDGMQCHIDPTMSFIYTSYANGVIYRINTSTAAQVTISENLPGGQQPGEWVTPYQLDPNNPAVIFAGYEALYRSANRGNTWTTLSTPIPGAIMNYLAVAPSNSNVIYIGYLDVVLRSVNGGSTWTNVTGSLPTGSVYLSGIQVDPADANAVVVTLSGYEANDKVYATTNGGGSWTNVTATGLPNLPVNCAEIDPATGDVYLGTDAGVFVWDAGTSGWVPYDQGLPNVVVTDLDLQHATSTLRAGTFGRGLWETNTISVGIGAHAPNAQVQLVPNPSNGQFTVNLGDPLTEVRSITLYSGLGQQVWQQDMPPLQGGRIDVDASELAPGVYVLHLHTNKGVRNARVVIEGGR
ncbi:MAG: T9SS type A sorting domain-containing protein [Flavobacteriales bacterium]|nr:T9SS type A sorting domain-containing protein [Flavobacteriales bacterium]